MRPRGPFSSASLVGWLVRVGVLLAVSFPASAANHALSASEQVVRLRDEVLARVKESYVDPVDVDKLTQGDLKALVREVDPEGEYLDQSTVRELSAPPADVGGIGLEFTARGEFLMITAPLDDSPAARTGLKTGDLIVKIDDMPVNGLTRMEWAKRLRGEPGTLVKLSVLRGGVGNSFDVVLQREIVSTQAVKLRELESGYIHIRISRFAGDTPAALTTQLRERYTQGDPKGLVLDLRNNPGGVLHGAVGVAAVFLQPNVLVASLAGRVQENNFNLYAAPQFYVRGGADFMKRLPAGVKTVPLVVLVNEGTAAGSEIVAGALQDYKRAVIVGTRTFGRASIQTILPMGNGAALKLTTARWVTPNKRSVHSIGLTPDVVSWQVQEEATQKNPSQDNQLEDALSLLKGEPGARN